MTRKVAIVGSTTFPLTAPLATQVVDVLRGLGSDAVILTRNGDCGFDKFLQSAALTLGLRCFSYRGDGGYDNARRDGDLVADADELVAFIDPDQLEVTRHGTAGMVERALSAGKPVRAATAVENNLVWADAVR